MDNKDKIKTRARWSRRRVLVALGASMVALVMAAPDPAVAQRDQDDALKARKKASILPYGQIRRSAENRFGGRVVGQRVRQISRDRWVYELRLLREDGQVISVVMDAHSGAVLGTRGE